MSANPLQVPQLEEAWQEWDDLPEEPLLPPPDDPWYYGWRYVRQETPDGEEHWEQVPLTWDDVLHPQEDDFVTTSDAHVWFCTYLITLLKARLADEPHAVAFSDMRIVWDHPTIRPMGPDISVIFGVRAKRAWSEFDVAEEGVGPTLVIEITSPSTRRQDLVTKREAYGQLGIPFYFIVDTITRRGTTIRRVLGYRLTPEGYVPLIPNEAGWLWMEPVRLWLGLRDDQVVCYEADGRPVEDYLELAAARDEAEQRAQAEAHARREAEQRAREAEARLRALEAELRRLRSDS